MLQKRHFLPSLFELIVITLIIAAVLGVILYERSGGGNHLAEPGGSQPIAPVIGGDWPPMLIIYEEQGVLVELHYQDERHWRKEVLRYPGSPDMEGLVTIYDGQSHTQYFPNTVDATTQEPSAISDPVPDGIVVPAHWLRPGLAASLVEGQFTVRPGQRPNQIEYVGTEQWPCSAVAQAGMPSTPDMPEICAANPAATFEVTERYVLSTSIEPPITASATIEHEGTVVWQARVQDIDLTPPALDLAPPTETP